MEIHDITYDGEWAQQTFLFLPILYHMKDKGKFDMTWTHPKMLILLACALSLINSGS